MNNLTVTKLSSGYGTIPVIRNLSLAVGAGEFIGLLGHNGMGKTTFFKTLVGNLPATSGQIRFMDQDIALARPHKRARAGIGYVPQGRGIMPGLTVHDNLRFAAIAVATAERTAVDKILNEFPRLRNYLSRPAGALSGGEQQLLALARALIQDPKLLLLDEPTEGIQPSIIEEMIELLSAQRERRNLTIVLVEQNVDFIKALANKIFVLQKGTIVKELLPTDITDDFALGHFEVRRTDR